MSEYSVAVERCYRHRTTVVVKADSEKEAEEKAREMMGNIIIPTVHQCTHCEDKVEVRCKLWQ